MQWMWAALCLMFFAELALAQPGPRRVHTVKQSGQLELESAERRAPGESRVTITVEGAARVIRANGIPDHLVGAFPNSGNPHSISAQRYELRVPAAPKQAETLTELGTHNWGVALNGVPFDPGAAEFWRGDRSSGWQYEALAGAVPLGIDENYAHVQPSGAYHYHGLPKAFLRSLGVSSQQHSPLVGWAADGFPVYALYGYLDPEGQESSIQQLGSSFRLRGGSRPTAAGQPGGTYDGTFVRDYEYVEDAGDLDRCNGRWTVTPEFPQGTYAYFLTAEWPVIPRCYRGTPHSSFVERRARPQRPRRGPGRRP
ncbi:MAG: YHYH protein [Acidobacteriota bacterium]